MAPRGGDMVGGDKAGARWFGGVPGEPTSRAWVAGQGAQASKGGSCPRTPSPRKPSLFNETLRGRYTIVVGLLLLSLIGKLASTSVALPATGSSRSTTRRRLRSSNAVVVAYRGATTRRRFFRGPECDQMVEAIGHSLSGREIYYVSWSYDGHHGVRSLPDGRGGRRGSAPTSTSVPTIPGRHRLYFDLSVENRSLLVYEGWVPAGGMGQYKIVFATDDLRAMSAVTDPKPGRQGTSGRRGGRRGT